MHPDIQKLLQLEEIDRDIARVRAEVAALPRRVAEIETQLAGVHQGVERSRKALKDIEATRRKREGDIQSLQQKISKYRDQMLAVKTNQEYKALGSEINFAEQEIRLIEDKILEGMLETEQHERDLKANEIEQKKQQASVEKEKAQARTRTEEDQKRLEELAPLRESLRKEIDEDHLQHYDRVLKRRGYAMGEAREQMCRACQVQLRPQVFLEIITAEEFLICDSCGRILFFVAENNPGVAGRRKEVLEPAAAEVPDPS